MTAYDLWFETDDATVSDNGPTTPRAIPQREPDGWTGSAGPAIASNAWPRGPLTGLPMMHAITLRLPAEWVEHNKGMPGFALFQGEGQFAAQRRIDSDDPFEKELLAAVEHPRLTLLEDEIGGRFALVRLSEAELASRSVPPPDVRRSGEHPPDDEGPNAWDETISNRRVWLSEREDPNSGIPPVDWLGADTNGPYKQPMTDEVLYQPWAEPLAARSHLGGTSFPAQEVPDGLGPWYLELTELPGMNLGGDGALQLDLESALFHWACG